MGNFFCCFSRNGYKNKKKAFLQKARRYLDQDSLNYDEDGELHCPLTLELFEDPVIEPHGFVFEREFVTDWIKRHHTHPILTDKKLRLKDLEDFPELLELVAEFRGQEPDALLY